MKTIFSTHGLMIFLRRKINTVRGKKKRKLYLCAFCFCFVTISFFLVDYEQTELFTVMIVSTVLVNVCRRPNPVVNRFFFFHISADSFGSSQHNLYGLIRIFTNSNGSYFVNTQMTISPNTRCSRGMRLHRRAVE